MNELREEDINGKGSNSVPLEFTDDPNLRKNLIYRQIEKCPADMALVEIIRNALQVKDCTLIHVLCRYYAFNTTDKELIESAKDRGYKILNSDNILDQSVVIYVPKISIRNNGTGIDKEKLLKITNIGHTIDDNAKTVRYGLGAKYAGLSHSPVGLLYTSRHDDPKTEDFFHSSLLRKFENGDYSRVVMQNDYVWPSYNFVKSMLDGELLHGKNKEKIELLQSEDDWTEVMLLGNHLLEDTTSMLERETKRKYWAAQVIYERFYDFSKINENCKIFIDSTMTSTTNTPFFKRVSCVSDLNSDKNPDIVYDEESGLEITFIRHSIDEESDEVVGERNSFFALVFENELYYKQKYGNSAIPGCRWYSYAVNFGINSQVSKEVSVIIKVSENVGLYTDDYRVQLFWKKDQSLLDAKDFSSIVQKHLPAWLTELNAKVCDNTDNSAMQERIKKHAEVAFADDEIKEKIVIQSKNGAREGQAIGDKIIPLDDYSRDKNGGDGTGKGSGIKGKPEIGSQLETNQDLFDDNKINLRGKRKTIKKNSETPNIFHLKDEQEIHAAGLDEYLASFEDKVIRINCKHKIFDTIAYKVIREKNKDTTLMLSVIDPVIEELISIQIITYFANMYHHQKHDLIFRQFYLNAISSPQITYAVESQIDLIVEKIEKLVSTKLNKIPAISSSPAHKTVHNNKPKSFRVIDAGETTSSERKPSDQEIQEAVIRSNGGSRSVLMEKEKLYGF